MTESAVVNGNFGFLSKLHPDAYKKLALAEQVSRTDFRRSGHETREAMEKIVSSIIERYDLQRQIPKALELSKKIESLRNEEILKAAGYLAPGDKLEDKPILPDIGTVRFKYEDGRSDENDYYDFMRKFGNTCSHADIRRSDVKVNYENVLKCLKGYHLFLRKYYADRIPNGTSAFNEAIMPIEEYHIYDAYVPGDTLRSKCMKEFLGYLTDSKGEKAFYAVLRLYNKSDVNEKFILRNTDTFVEASRLSISSVPEGMTKMRELTRYNDNASSFYIISYEFNREPKKLTESILKNMDIGKRVKMCSRIASCFYNLHKSEVPIYHRMLSYESIYVCDYGKEWVPYVIKFDFAKIDSGDAARTVFEDTVKAKERLQELKQLKYLAPEWSTTKHTSDANWGKMDIYSLGVLFSDILTGMIGTSAASIDELEELDLSDDLLDLLDAMRADSPQVRNDIEEVQLVLEEEVRRWR